MNPQGVLIGRGATVHTGGDFLASTLNLSNSAFLNSGSLLFGGPSTATVVNLGDLTSSGGSIYLIGHGVQNGGSIIAPNGTVSLGAGSQILISDSASDQRVFVQAPGGDVTNSGYINAAQVELRSNGGSWLLDPGDLTIDAALARTIETSLDGGSGDITVASNIAWTGGAGLSLSAYRNIGLNTGVIISNGGAGNLTLRADNAATGMGTVTFNGSARIDYSQSTGTMSLLYNPTDTPIVPLFDSLTNTSIRYNTPHQLFFFRHN